jgi:hypothetical protein
VRRAALPASLTSLHSPILYHPRISYISWCALKTEEALEQFHYALEANASTAKRTMTVAMRKFT